jgi:hypothetical protein
MTKKERQNIRKELPQWTEEFVQREWYREFLQIYPLNEYPSLLEIMPPIDIMIHDYINEFNLQILEKFNDFLNKLRWDFLHLYYNNISADIIKLRKKYGEIVYKDLNHITLCAMWFERNEKLNLKLDKKYNIT